MSTSAPSSSAQEDGGTLQHAPGGRSRSRPRGRASSRRAARYRSTDLQYLQEQVTRGLDHETVRQRYDTFRASAQQGVNNLNNIGDDELRTQLDEFQGLVSFRSEELRQSHQEATMDKYKLMHVPRIGFLPSPRPHGSFRWMYCQVNGLASMASRKAKIFDTWALAEQYDVDGIAFVEVGINWRKFKTSGRLSSWFESMAEREIRSTEAFNTRGPTVSVHQQGGTPYYSATAFWNIVGAQHMMAAILVDGHPGSFKATQIIARGSSQHTAQGPRRMRGHRRFTPNI